MNAPFRGFTLILGILAVAIVAMWGISFYKAGFYGYGHGMMAFMPMSGMLVMALVLAVVGLGVWWLLSSLFWHKYFPTQSPPKPPVSLPQGSKADFSDSALDRHELDMRLDALEKALLEGRISEETYRELKEKYEKKLYG